MPIFMDLHIVPGIEAKHAAEAHREDLKIQDEFGCRCMTYWVDEERGSAFCLIDAPSKEAVLQMHNNAHGLIPHEIIQVNSDAVDAFLGRIHDPEDYKYLDDPNLKIFNDPAFRIILVIQTRDVKLLHYELGAEKTKRFFSLLSEVVKEQIKNHEGREIETTEEGFVVSFVSVSEAIQCAFHIQKALHVAAEIIDLRMGLHAGMPVSKDHELFGTTLKLARYLCHMGKENQIVMSSVVRNLNKVNYQKMTERTASVRCINPSEESFLESIITVLNENWQNPQFNLNGFCTALSTSKSQLYRKCTTTIGMSPNALLREYRLQKSLYLLKREKGNISQTTFDSGFNSPSYFTKCFQKRFGLQPLSYLKIQA